MPSTAAAAIATCIAIFNLESYTVYDTLVVASDGTTQGTEVLFAPPRKADDFTNVGKTILFANTMPNGGRELWETDGTAAGSKIFKDIYQGPVGSDPGGAAYSHRFAKSGNVAVFSARNAKSGKEMWVSNGTPGGTEILRDFAKGTANGVKEDTYYYGQYVASDGKTNYFLADDGSGGQTLWSTDGTRAGVTRAAPKHLDGRKIKAAGFLGRNFLFSYGGQLWKTRGSTKNARMIKDLGYAEISIGYNSDQPYALLRVETQELGIEPWVTDGTATGTQLLKDIWPSKRSSSPGPFEQIGKYTVFAADSPEYGREIWVTRGTPESTRLLTDLAKDNKSSSPRSFVQLNSKLVFTALVSKGSKVEPSLMITDGTAEGTRKLSSFARPTGEMVSIGKQVLFENSGGTAELWTTSEKYNDQKLVMSFRNVLPNSSIEGMWAVNTYRGAKRATTCPGE